ncbi:N-acetylglucosamine kinase [Streptomyces sp. NBC_00094]|uniref:N-acetylglucosamine kinase n=1 Tax=Streptomyces sp. NBC_00094 TaxID=2903620 RepID=UPI002257DDB0|nr:BadF/BadG/BcrA/BcrD ATPase family protein [Streptomyces sp. NBC_00094]MCX5389101.1 ATPase [Streptomyces sp. NBC_00094]
MGLNAAVLAIDAGNSKTDVALIGADGRVLGRARGDGFQPSARGVESAVGVLDAAVREAAEAAGLSGPGPVALHVAACLANADFPEEEGELADEIERRGWGRQVAVRNDTFALLRAGTVEPRGVAVVCGAGINCVGMTPDGRTARFPAIGKISGDWGGGSGMAEEALWFAARAEDGRGEPTELARALPAHFGLETMYALIEALHFERIPKQRTHELPPVLFAVAEEGDLVARALVDRQAEEIVALATAALEKLDLMTGPADVVLGGGILAARHPLLDGGIRRRLADHAPMAVPLVVTDPPVMGAALLGLDELGAPPSSFANLRACFT